MAILLSFLILVSTLGIWRQASDLGDIGLYSQVPQPLELALASSAPNTLSKYSNGWNRWPAWAKSKNTVPHLPAQPLHIALLGHGSSVIDTALYSIRWGHKVAGIPSPVDHPTVLTAPEGGRRKLARPIQPKEPISEQTLFKLAGHYNTPGAPLETLGFLFIILIGYAGLFRISEVLSIRVCDIDFHESYMSIFVPIRKNDQHHEGHTSVLAKSGKITCPVSITEQLVGLLPSTADSRLCPVVRRIVKTKKQERSHDRLGISYSAALENI